MRGNSNPATPMKAPFPLRPRTLRSLALALLFAAGLVTTAAAEPLVSVQWLAGHRSDPDIVVLDLSLIHI